MARPRKYSEELRRRAIDEVVERGRKIPDVARDLGMGSPGTLRAWSRPSETVVRSVDSGRRDRYPERRASGRHRYEHIRLSGLGPPHGQ